MAGNSESSAKIFLVDDHPAVRQGLTVLLSQKNHTICGEAADREETFRLLDNAKPNLVILDLSLPDESGLALMQDLKARGMRVLIYSMHEDAAVIERAFGLGASGYVTKRDGVSELLDAVDEICGGGRYISAIAAQSLSVSLVSENESHRVSLLSAREREIVRKIGRGAANEEIAAELGITIRTLETYFARIMEKLNVNGMKNLRRYAISKEALFRL